MGKVRTHSPDKPRIKTQTVKKKRIETKPKKTAATRDAEKVKDRKRTRKAHTPRSARIVTVRGVPYRLRKFESLGPRLLPETMFTRKGQTLRQLIRNTPAYYLANAVDVDAHRYKVAATKTGKPVVRGIMVTNDPFRPFKVKRYHETYIIGLDTDQKKPVHKHRKVLVQCTCVTGDTKVLTDKGWQTIFEIAQPFEPDYYPVNYNVKGEMFAGSAPFYTGLKPVYKLTLSNGQTITATGEHRFLQHVALGNLKFREDWKELKDLSVGDALLMNEFTQPKLKRGQDFLESFFIGVMQGDGTLFASGRPNLKLFGKKTGILKKLTELGVVKDVSAVKGRDATNVQFNHRAIELCARYGFDNKKSVKLETLEQTLGYLSGLIATDGTTYKNGEILIRGAKDYLEQLVWKLMEYGYTQTTFYRERAAGVATSQADKNYDVCVSTKEMWALRISPHADIVKNLMLSDYHRERMQRAEKTRPRKSWTKIVDITYAGKQHVYDITVPGPHRFAANGLIAHNCEAYVYTYEYANAYFGAAYMLYCNGEPPVMKNPGLAVGLCKHLVALAKIAMDNNL